MSFIMYDLNDDGEKVNIIYVEGSDKPEKVYKDRCEHYGDVRDFWKLIDYRKHIQDNITSGK